jgi:hypothetical protein
MTKAISIGFSLLLVTAGGLYAQDPATYEGPKDKLHIYLLIGQSNMAGRAPYTEEEAGVVDRCFLLNGDDKFEPAKNPLNRYSTIRKGLEMQKMNPGYTFSKKMLKAQPGISIGLVVNAKGGSRIEQWKKGTQFYADAIRRTKEAQKAGTLKGILWHQGESNSKAPDGYTDKLAALVKDLRTDLGIKDLPFVAGQIINHDAINAEVAKLPEKSPATSFVSSDGLKGQDRWHFNADSMRKLGERYADEMLKLQKK